VRFLGPALTAWLLLIAVRGDAAITERVVAVVDDRAILWTDLLKRATAPRIQIRMQTGNPSVVLVQEQEMYRELLDRLIDDRLEEQQAAKAHVTVTPDEIDRAIENIAAQAQAQRGQALTVQGVLAVARSRGMAETDFRDEIRRQILEGKLLEMRVRPRVRVTERDVRAAYDRWRSGLAPGVLVPTLDEVRDAMTERAWLEAMERGRVGWLADLRRAAYVDVRL
jgi:peptidyl-prolyl cis-trans isomerase SurA